MRTVVIATLFATALAAADLDVPGVVEVAGKPYSNAVVWIETSVRVPRDQKQPPVLDQRNLRFSPQVLAVQVGTRVKFPNSDRVFHNVFSYKDGKRFDLGFYPTGAVKFEVFDKAGVSRLFCNIHPQMAAYVVAVDSPFFAVSDENGRFVLGGVPAGSHTYRAWRSGGPELRGTFVAAPGAELEVRWP